MNQILAAQLITDGVAIKEESEEDTIQLIIPTFDRYTGKKGDPEIVSYKKSELQKEIDGIDSRIAGLTDQKNALIAILKGETK